ncbi:MAG: DNA helicase PcrA [Alicyclobacillaceae bacterium]|nr:DNA helicase PcrA [Alicyclobacillaceae bacterium]
MNMGLDARATEEDALAGLNPEQRQAVQTTEGPLLIVAGAGSGKTRVLTRRIAYLIHRRQVVPWSILAITFTNKAAREMRERIEALVGVRANDVTASTFHALCARVLRRDIDRLGYTSGFTVLDGQDSLSLVRKILRDANVDVKKFEPRAILSAISGHKNVLKTASRAKEEASDLYGQLVANTYLEYERRLKRNNSLDFDDLIGKTIELFRSAPDVLQFYQNKFRYIHVDEYQDTNHAQYVLVRMLADAHRNLCVVGDSDQSIYGWRGADIQNILQFERDYPEAVVVRLEQNYRSSQTILDIANNVIANNHGRASKRLWSDRGEGEKATLFRCPDERVEAVAVATELEAWCRDGGHYTDAAILYRTNAQSRVLEEVLLQRGIPYRIYGGVRFYERKEIRDLLAYLRLAANPADDPSFLRAVNVPKRGIGDTSLAKLVAYADANGLALVDAADKLEQTGVSGKAIGSLRSFVELISNLQQMASFLNVTELVEQIIERSGYREALEAEKSLEAAARLENLDEFLSLTKQFDENWKDVDAADRLGQFLTEVALVADTDLDNGRPADETDDVVTLMTLHSAKGLEFPVVFLVGLEEGMFPHSRTLFDATEMEEERRLCYVGVTRAMRCLYLSTCSQRMIYGGIRTYSPSRFLEEMPAHCLQVVQPGSPRVAVAPDRGTRQSGQIAAPHIPKGFGANLDVTYEVGDHVEHRKWGLGVILATAGQGEDLEMTVTFPAPIGERKLVARFAPIHKVD